MRAHILGGLIASCVLLATGTALAHHSFAAEFDANKPITLKGRVTKVEWTNPHVWFYINVKDEKTGEVSQLGRRDGTAARSAAPRMASRDVEDWRRGHGRRLPRQERQQPHERDDRSP